MEVKRDVFHEEDLIEDIVLALRINFEGMSRTDLSNYFAKHKKSSLIVKSIKILIREGLVISWKEKTNGRVATFFKLVC